MCAQGTRNNRVFESIRVIQFRFMDAVLENLNI